MGTVKLTLAVGGLIVNSRPVSLVTPWGVVGRAVPGVFLGVLQRGSRCTPETAAGNVTPSRCDEARDRDREAVIRAVRREWGDE